MQGGTMMRFKFVSVLIVVLLLVPAVAIAEFDFSLLVDNLNVSANSDRSRFKHEVSVEFGISVGRFDHLAATLGSAGDAYMSLRIGKLSLRSVDDVVRIRQSSPGKGWGKIARQMGIKPGSDEFMRLKQVWGKKQKKSNKSKNKSKNKKHR
jgi:hypothetical protein